MRDRDLTGLDLLRQKAEQEWALRQSLKNSSENGHSAYSHSIEEYKRINYELEISQLILEMQNRELQAALEKASTATAFYEHSPAGCFTLNNKGSILELNTNGAKMLQKKRSDLLGTDFTDFVSQDTKPAFHDFLIKIIGTKTRHNCEIELAVGEKPCICIYLEGFLCETTQNCLVRAVDITGQKCSQEAISTSESRLKRAELVSKTGNWELHLDTRKIFASDGAFKIYGVDKGEFNFDQIKTNTLPEYRSLLDLKMQQLIEGKSAYDVEFKIKARDSGEIKDIRSIATYDPARRIVFGVVHDITEQKIMEQRIHESEQYYRSMVETSPDAIVIVDTIGNVQFTSQKAYELFNIPPDFPAVGSSLVSWIAPDMREFTLNRFKSIIMGTVDSEPFEYKILKNDGSWIWTEIHGSRLHGTLGQTQGMFLICRDITERKQAEETMRESEIFIKQSQRAANIGSYRLDIASGWWKSSEVLDQIFGITEKHEKTICEWVDIVHPEDREMMDRYFKEDIIVKQNPFNKDYRIVRKSDGQVRWVHGLGELEVDENGIVYSMIGTVQDITERKQAEEAIQQAHDQLKSLHDNLDEAIFSFDVINKKMLQASRAHEDIFGYPPSEFYNNSNLWYEVVIDEDKHIIDEGFPLITAGETRQHEFRIKRPDGQIRWIAARMHPKMNHEGKCVQIDGVAYDITQRKKAEEESRDSEERFRMVFENVFDGIALFEENEDPFKRKLVECNKQYAMMAGRSREELLAMGYIHHLQTSLEKNNNSVRLESLAQQKAYRGSSSWIRPDGQENVIEYIGVPITWRGKSYSIGIDRDITSRIQAQAELIAAKEKAEESDRLKSAFLANMSHEIRTPLNSIIGFSELMSEPDFDHDQLPQFATIIQNSGNNLLSIISDIMDISKIEAGLVQIRKHEFSVSRLINNLHKEYTFQAIKKGIELTIDPSNPIEEMYICSDETKLRQIIINLLGNAIKFTEEGYVELSMKTTGKFLQFHVKDTGIGIPDEYQKQIFERFHQIESSLSRRYGGNGLGLAISRSLAELLGGSLWMESKQGKGSTFYFNIPLEN
ncbi:MAG: PAS domain-containing sensor histidine kinase [Methylococcaceae bacterium]